MIFQICRSRVKQAIHENYVGLDNVRVIMYVKIQRHQPCISKYISDPTLYLFKILNIRNCVLYGDIASTKICSSIERFGGFNIDSDKTKLPPSSGT